MNSPFAIQQTRLASLGKTSQGLGAVALASLLHPRIGVGGFGGVSKALPLPQKAKRVIWLTMAGRAFASGDLRSEAEARGDARQADASSSSRSFRASR